MRPPTSREWKDASRTAFIVASTTAAAAFAFAYAGIPPSTPSKGTFRSNVVRDLSWMAVAAVSMASPLLGSSGAKGIERLIGNIVGGGLGMAAVLAHDPWAATAIAFFTGLVGDLAGPVLGAASAGSISTTTYVVVAMPAFTTFGVPRSWEVDALMARQAGERIFVVTVAIALVYFLSISWYPHAASEDAFDHAAATLARVREMGVSAFAPAALLEGGHGGGAEDEEGRGGAENKAPPPSLPVPVPPPPHHPPQLSKQAVARAAVKGAYLARIQTAVLAPALDPVMRAAHLAEVEGRLAAAIAARNKLSASLGVASKEVVMGRVPLLRCKDGVFGACVSGGGPDRGVARKRGHAASSVPSSPVVASAADAALPTPPPASLDPATRLLAAGVAAGPTKRAPASPSPPSFSVAWCPLYLPTFGTGGSAWIRRLAPRHFSRRALPSAQLEDVGRACGSVARALWMVGDAAGGGFEGNGGQAASVVAELSGLVEACLTEALAGLTAARTTFVAGRPPADGRSVVAEGRSVAARGASAATILASVRARWPTLRALQDAQVRLVGLGGGAGGADAADRLPPEEAILKAGGFGAVGSSHEPAAVAARVRWLTLLFGISEARRGLEELAAGVEALRDACECAALAKRGGVALLEEEVEKGEA